MFVVDSNVFIQAANSYYAFDLVPAFWTWLEGRLGDDIFTVVPVQSEILAQKDDLSDWISQNSNSSWILPVDDEPTQLQMPELTQHCVNLSYKMPGIQKFLSGADPWVISAARSRSWTVVTHEEPNPATKKRVKIPDVCDALRVRNLRGFDMMRQLGFSAQ